MAGARLEIRDEDGWTALMHAAVTDHADGSAVIRLLIARGANLGARESNGLTVLGLARDWMKSGLKIGPAVRTLEAAGAPP